MPPLGKRPCCFLLLLLWEGRGAQGAPHVGAFQVRRKAASEWVWAVQGAREERAVGKEEAASGRKA